MLNLLLNQYTFVNGCGHHEEEHIQ